VRLELLAIGAVVHPFPGRRDPLAGGDHRGMADDGDQLAMTPRFDAEHTKAAVGVMECDPFNQASENLTGRRRRRLVCQKGIPQWQRAPPPFIERQISRRLCLAYPVPRHHQRRDRKRRAPACRSSKKHSTLRDQARPYRQRCEFERRGKDSCASPIV
jgi:hypothetical protein